MPRSREERLALLCFLLAALTLLIGHARPVEAQEGHGPEAPASRFPSHVFQLAPRAPRAQIAFHYGLVQPILLHGFNAAVDLRFGRFVLTYSHGQGLQPDRTPGLLTAHEKDAGLNLSEPYSTGGGVGITLIDELYVLADVKVHHFEAELAGDHASYTTVTVGAELGYRFFLWKGFYLSPVVRYWPNVWNSAGGEVRLHDAKGSELVHKPVSQGVQGSGVFVNLLVGWAFDLTSS